MSQRRPGEIDRLEPARRVLESRLKVQLPIAFGRVRLGRHGDLDNPLPPSGAGVVSVSGLVAAMLASRDFKGIRRKRLPIFMLGADAEAARALAYRLDNLETGGGKYPLNDHRHNDHLKNYVQSYLEQFGATAPGNARPTR
jgi:hypothetical protein